MNKVLKKILIKTKHNIFSSNIGNNSSLIKGEGYDFCELKEYEYGDDVKNIDWVITAKMQKPYVKQFYAQKELNIKIVPFLSGSVYFGTKKFKQETITELCSALAYISVKQGDPFASYIANESLELCTKKSKRIFDVNMMSQKIYEYNVLGKHIDYKKVTNELFKSIHHKSIIFLIGDFFDISNLDLKLLCKKHEVIALIVRDRFEENLAEFSNTNFIDPSSNISYEGNINNKTIQNYKKEVEKNDNLLYKHFQDCAIKFTKIYTHEDSIKKLIGVLR